MNRPVIRKHNPATLELVGEVECALPEEVPPMVERARTAQIAWATLPLKERSRILRNVQVRMLEDTDGMSEIVSRETGKPAMESLATDVMNAISVGDFAIERMERIFQESTVDMGSLSLMMRYMARTSRLIPRPLGVIGVISPWNYPLAIPYSQTMMCLAAGNGVVLKPSSMTPLTAIRMRDVMIKAGVPEDLLQIAIGGGGDVGEALVTSGVDRILFTGSSDVGRKIMSLASQRLTPVTLELGGKDPFIVLKDADLRRAAKAACWYSFINAGQTCAAVKRIYAQASIIDEFTDLLLKEVRSLKQGYDLSDPTIGIGSLISEEAVAHMGSQVTRAVEQGAVVLTGGQRPVGLKGHFFQPTVLGNVRQDMDIVREETFGPIVALLPFDEEEDVVRMANDNPYALAGSIWTNDLSKGKRMATSLRSGTVVVNNVPYTYGVGATPWGGRGESGFGRTHGDMGFEELIERQHVHLDHGKFSSEIWWHPYGREGMDAMRDFTGLAFSGERDRLVQRLLGARRLMKR